MTTQLFTARDYEALAAIVFRPDYPGNATARGVIEAPNGDIAARDTGKRYSHVATKYLKAYSRDVPGASGRVAQLEHYLDLAFARALQVATALGVPPAYMPSFNHGALRVLEYPPGASSHVHTDFDLFTLLCYRDDDQGLRRKVSKDERDRLDRIDRGLHIGELADLISGGIETATPHEVWEADHYQHSIVYFAIPDHAAVIPVSTVVGAQEVTVGQWLAARLARSRYQTP